MRDREPLEEWLLWHTHEPTPDERARREVEVNLALDRLEAYLDNPPPKPKRNMDSVNFYGFSWGLADEDVPRVQELYPRVVEAGGTGSSYVQESLLNLVADREDPETIPFWLSLLDLKRPRDMFRVRRQTIALAALARMGIKGKVPEAVEALLQATRHADAQVRTLALYYLGWTYGFEGRKAAIEQMGPPFLRGMPSLDPMDVELLMIFNMLDQLAQQMLSLSPEELQAIIAGAPPPLAELMNSLAEQIHQYDGMPVEPAPADPEGLAALLETLGQKLQQLSPEALEALFAEEALEAGPPALWEEDEWDDDDEDWEEEGDWDEDEEVEVPLLPVPQEVLAVVTNIALTDAAFLPRYQARLLMREAGETVPLDNPDGVYAFKVKLMWDKRTNRTIELRSRQTLEHLHQAIQRAFRWDDDHLYSFFLNGEAWDDLYRVSSPHEEDGPWTTQVVIGELGLVKGHKFLYLFDYGDEHQFEVEVVEIRAKAERGRYPRLVDSKGDAPPQYWWPDEDEFEE